jgi:response regulator RpfG family c-di-GMP phosphodiesterase
MTPVKILCVDDEPQVIEGLSLHLRREYAVTPAHSGAEGLAALDSQGPFAVVLSDMRMPGMDGASFLAQMRKRAPETVRMLLTGNTDQQTAIAAVNQGQIFRFLSKPCPPDQLRMAFKAATEQHRLITAERVLLEQTLHGSIKMLVDVLSLTNPVSFGRAMRVKNHVSQLCEKLGLKDRWQVEVAAMLSQLGCITLPADTVEKLYYGQALSDQEKELVSRLPQVTEQLLGNIPRLEVVRGILIKSAKQYHRGTSTQEDPELQLIERCGQMLKVVLDYDALDAQGNSAVLAFDILRGRTECYDSGVLEAFAAIRCNGDQKEEIRALPVSAIREGMVLVEDLKMANGTLLAARGYEVTPSFVERARHFRPGYVKGPIRVIVRGGNPAEIGK